MTDQEVVAAIHPAGEPRTAPDQTPEAVGSVDTFAGKVQVKWAPEAEVSSLGRMPLFIEFLKTSGLLENWVQDCPWSIGVRTLRRSGTCWARFCDRCWPGIGSRRTSTRFGAMESIPHGWA